jgi:N-acyl amino acid synthase of PEP-CTERM/exosortase system
MEASVSALRTDYRPLENLLARYNRDYECQLADNPDLVRRAFETRYQVYCVENHFESAAEHGDGLESDEYDGRSSHCVLTYRPTGEVMGTVRLILPAGGRLDSFSMRGIAEKTGGNLPIPAASTAEVSRFSISKRSRPETSSHGHNLREMAGALRRAEPLMSLGLIQGLVRMSAMHRITHWCAVMEPKMLRMLSAMGIHFIPVGEPVEYHGLRQLCYVEVGAVLRSMERERPSFWEIVADQGAMKLAMAC